MKISADVLPPATRPNILCPKKLDIKSKLLLCRSHTLNRQSFKTGINIS